ncbi:hypothetical protein M4I32_03790 [Microbacterium sp. LRZ72]|uniref:hypothetical protein n=1 Tax=Microbacterium sp. LRZ72 TaxID=2942481 RepID=UPI0029A58E94|nr:hypothetical protein [Microbacterium sp. LRZ72]MDX2375918.1 hypothetical protein [Microbacterium sp. LRZ72]
MSHSRDPEEEQQITEPPQEPRPDADADAAAEAGPASDETESLADRPDIPPSPDPI